MKSQPPERVRRGAIALSRFLIPVAFVALPCLALAQSEGLFAANPGINIALTVAILIATIFLNGVFVAADTSMELLRPMHIKAFEKDDPRVAKVQQLLDNKQMYIAACTLGSQTMRAWMMLLCFVPAPAIAGWAAAQWGWAENWLTIFAAAIVVSFPVAAVNLVWELVAKSYSVLHPCKNALRFRHVMRFFAVVFAIPGKFVTAIGGLITRRFGGRASFVITNPTETEIKELVETAEESGEIEVDERKLLHSVFEFTDTVAREVMTPRVDIDALPIDSPPQDFIRLIEDSGHSRIPVYEGTDDQIIGIVHAKDLLMTYFRNPEAVSIRKLMRQPLFVPENKNLHELLGEMRMSRAQMAVVQDEFGGTAGIVTIEDIVEELVGEIVDEYDIEEPEIVQNGSGYLVEGKVNLYDLNSEIGSQFESDEFDTVGGYVFGLFGRQPKAGEAIESDGYKFEVEETDGRRIMRLHVERLEDPELTASATSGNGR